MKQFSLFKTSLLTFLLVSICTFSLFSQVTTSSINGAVTDEKGGILPGTSIVAIHLPSGTRYGTTNPAGRFNLPNVRVGGPYSIQATFVGFKTSKTEGFSLNLGQNLSKILS